jgi:hypothetical protein
MGEPSDIGRVSRRLPNLAPRLVSARRIEWDGRQALTERDVTLLYAERKQQVLSPLRFDALPKMANPNHSELKGKPPRLLPGRPNINFRHWWES